MTVSQNLRKAAGKASRAVLPGQTRPGASAKPTTPPTSDWTRESVFGEKFNHRALEEFTAEHPPVEWLETNDYLGQPVDDIVAAFTKMGKWRYHHDLDALRGGRLYWQYAERVDAMLMLVDRALALANVDVPASSFLDIGAAEGYTVNHLLDRGARDVDAVELNQMNIERMWQVRAIKGLDTGRIGRIDLENVNWSKALGRTYDVTMALGVIYHMENPGIFARNLYAATNSVTVIESDTPVFPGNKTFRGYGALYLHRDQVTLAADDVRYITEMRPDRQALAELLLAAGFKEVHAIDPRDGEEAKYFDKGSKSVLVAIK